MASCSSSTKSSETQKLLGPETSHVWEGTWKSRRYPFVKGKVYVLSREPEIVGDYCTEGYLTFDGCYRHGCVTKICVSVATGEHPPTTGSATATCGKMNFVLSLSEYHPETQSVTGTYRAHNPSDEGTVALHRTDATELSFTPCSGWRGIFSLFA